MVGEQRGKHLRWKPHVVGRHVLSLARESEDILKTYFDNVDDEFVEGDVDTAKQIMLQLSRSLESLAMALKGIQERQDLLRKEDEN